MYLFQYNDGLVMSSWLDKAQQANQKAVNATKLLATAGQKKGDEQTNTIMEASRLYQEAWKESMEAFTEGIREYGEEQMNVYKDFFTQIQRNIEEMFKKFS